MSRHLLYIVVIFYVLSGEVGSPLDKGVYKNEKIISYLRDGCINGNTC
jgi:hypothetical protein